MANLFYVQNCFDQLLLEMAQLLLKGDVASHIFMHECQSSDVFFS